MTATATEIETLARECAAEAWGVGGREGLDGRTAGDEPGNVDAMKALVGGAPTRAQWDAFVAAYDQRLVELRRAEVVAVELAVTSITVSGAHIDVTYNRAPEPDESLDASVAADVRSRYTKMARELAAKTGQKSVEVYGESADCSGWMIGEVEA